MRLVVFGLISAIASVALAQTTKPALVAMGEFDRGVQALYHEVHESVVRVVVPLQVSPQAVDARLRQQMEMNNAMRVFVERRLDATQPLDLKKAEPTTRPGVPLSPTARVVPAEFLGVVLDESGDVLLPLYVDKQLVGDASLRVTYGDNQVTSAKLLGSDRQTNLAVVKLQQPVGKPVKMTSEHPNDGALVLMLSPVRRQERLSIWTGGQEEHAVVMNSAGAMVGIVRYGHLFEPSAFAPVTQQLIETGKVKRAVLGVFIVELGPEDPARLKYPQTLGNHPATRVDALAPGSAADKAGLQQGDIILSLGGDPVNDLAHFAAAISKRTGTTTPLKILRDGKEMELSVDLTPREEPVR